VLAGAGCAGLDVEAIGPADLTVDSSPAAAHLDGGRDPVAVPDRGGREPDPTVGRHLDLGGCLVVGIVEDRDVGGGAPGCVVGDHDRHLGGAARTTGCAAAAEPGG